MSVRARSRPFRLLAAALSVTGLATASCGGGDAADGRPAATSTTVSGEIVVFAAASLTDAFTELADVFTEAHPEASVTFNFAASSALVSQIVEGAPADVYASADEDNMARLSDAGAAATEPVTFASNRSEIAVAPGNPLGIGGVEDLANDDLILVVCAPEVPCGTYAAGILDNAGVEAAPDSYEENVRAVLTKVALGEADAGIVYVTDVIAARDEVDGVEIPAELNVVADYPIAAATEGANPAGARAFIDLVVGAEGQAVLASYGFGAP